MNHKVKIGVIGCGAISGAYLSMAKNFPILDVVACADLDFDKARSQAEKFQVPRACSVDELLDDPSVEIVLNLTIPRAHAPVALRAIEKGKHTYAEKPLGVSREEGQRILRAAAERNVLVGCAPDTFMGAGIQIARKLIDDGVIGRPVGFMAFMLSRGHESWHPNPEFYYQPGGGPMFDMGPYYLTALLNLLGPVKRLASSATVAIPRRTITSKPKFGQAIEVQTPDHIVGTMEFENGAAGTIITSFATTHPGRSHPQPITIFGTEGALRVPDPNAFDGDVYLFDGKSDDWREMPHTFVKGYGRAVGVADMACAIRSGRKFRASGEQGMAVLDLMEGFLDSSRLGAFFEPSTRYERPAPMRADLPFGTLD